MSTGPRSSRIGLYGAVLGLVTGLAITAAGYWFARVPEAAPPPVAGPSRSGAILGDGGAAPISPAPRSLDAGSLQGKVYALHRIAEAQIHTGDTASAIQTLRRIDSAADRDHTLQVLLQTYRQDRLFDPYAGRPADTEAETNRVDLYKTMIALCEEISDPALQAGFYARLAEMRFDLRTLLPETLEPRYHTLLERASSAADRIAPEPPATPRSQAWLLGMWGAITTALTTAAGFLLSNFTKAVLGEWGKTASAFRWSKTEEKVAASPAPSGNAVG